MQKRFETAIWRHGMFRQGDTVIAAVSGGADSLCLLRLLVDIAARWQLHVHVAHLHHQLRGRDADDDAAFVTKVAEQWGCPVHIGRADVAALAAQRGKGIEEAGREARYRFFSSLAQKVGAQAVALGHHADDQAETVLLRLIRGTGTTGLGAMSPVRDLADGVKLVRPLLAMQRSEIEAFLRQRGICWRLDATNTSTDYLRNRIRHELIPYLCAQYNPRLPQALAHTAEILQTEDACLEAMVDQLMPYGLHDRFGLVNVDRSLVCSQPTAIKRRLLRRLISAATGHKADFEHIVRLAQYVDSGKPSWEYSLPSKGTVVASQGRLLFLNREQLDPERVDLVWDVPGTIIVPSLAARLTAQLVRRASTMGDNSHALDARLASSRLVIRSWQPGDAIRLPGSAGKKKLSDLFIDMKVPAPHRRRIPIVTSNGEIVWVVGLAVSGDYRASPEAQTILLVEYETVNAKGGA